MVICRRGNSLVSAWSGSGVALRALLVVVRTRGGCTEENTLDWRVCYAVLQLRNERHGRTQCTLA